MKLSPSPGGPLNERGEEERRQEGEEKRGGEGERRGHALSPVPNQCLTSS